VGDRTGLPGGRYITEHSTSIAPSRHAPAEARRHVATVCEDWPPAQLQVAQLLTTEVVTNAVLHGSGDVALRLVCSRQLLRVEVGDTCAWVPTRVRRDDARREGGRGLVILAALAAAWGVELHDGGKTVWFEVRWSGVDMEDTRTA
jgi:anti-sigma regulatory factor (Ser/Thr protein kinase)